MIAVTASSFIKDRSLCTLLEQAFPSERITFLRGAESLNPSELTRSIEGARGWIVGKEECTSEVLSGLIPTLKVVSKYGVGLDNIDIEACGRMNVKVYHEPGVNKEYVAEHTLGLMIGLLRRIEQNSFLLHNGEWNKDGGISIFGKKVGIVGLGNIGGCVAALLNVFRCELAYYDIEEKKELEQSLNVKRLEFDELLAWADIVSFHVPLTNKTRHMLNHNTIKSLNTGVYIINTSRGPVIDQKVLLEALKSGLLGGAALDVFESEPLLDKDLYQQRNLIATPHTAGNSREAVIAMGSAAIRGLKLHLSRD